MLSFNELIGFMSAELADEIVTSTFENDKDLYRATLAAVAEARKVRVIFLQRKPRPERNKVILNALGKPAMAAASGNLIRGWLIHQHTDMLGDFLDAMGIEHKEGMVEELPEQMEADTLKKGVEKILSKYRHDIVAVYLHTFNSMNDTRWDSLDELLDADERLQFA